MTRAREADVDLRSLQAAQENAGRADAEAKSSLSQLALVQGEITAAQVRMSELETSLARVATN